MFERVCACVCEYLAGSRWPWIKTGDECREQESGGAWLGQAMGDNMASHLLEANTHTPYMYATKCNPSHSKHTHFLPQIHMQMHMRKYMCSQRL